MLRMHREGKTSMCILKLNNQVTKLTSVADDLENFAMFSDVLHREFYTSAP